MIRYVEGLLEGRVVAAARVQEHVSLHGERALLRVLIQFEDGSRVVLRGAPSGDALLLESAAEPAAADMAEYGVIEITDAPQFLPTGAEIQDATPLVDDRGITFGVALRTTAGAESYIYNWGDDLYFVEELPSEVHAAIRS